MNLPRLRECNDEYCLAGHYAYSPHCHCGSAFYNGPPCNEAIEDGFYTCHAHYKYYSSWRRGKDASASTEKAKAKQV